MPFDPTQLTGITAWYRPDTGVTQTNCAKFVRISQNYLSLSPTNTTWLDGLSKLTVAVDVRPSDVTFRQGWVSRWGPSNAGQFILRCQGYPNTGAIFFIVANSTSDTGANYVYTDNNVLVPGFPVRVVVVFDTGTCTIYVNGAAVSTHIAGTIPSSLTTGSGAALGVGADYAQLFQHDGLMSRLCIWAGTALTPAQVTSDFNTFIGVDPASGEPVTPTHAWRLDEGCGTRVDCIGTLNLTDNNATGSEAHVSAIADKSGAGHNAAIRPINGPTYISSGIKGRPTIKHVAANAQFLVCGLLSGATKPSAWSLYAVAKCTSTLQNEVPSEPGQQSSNGLVNNFGVAGQDWQTWLVCVIGDYGSLVTPDGSFGMGCGNDTGQLYNQANSPLHTYSANTWFQLTGIFPGGITHVNTWFNGTSQTMNPISGAVDCACAGTAHATVIGAATAEGTGASGVGVINNDFFDGEWADIVVCTADTTSQRTLEETYQQNWYL